MAYSPISRPNSSDARGPSDAPIPLAENDSDELESLSLADLATALSSYGGGDLSADLALDLVLNEIVEQARLATNATAAAIALAREGEIVCRATTGANAPDLGVRLDSQSGLSGACVQTNKWQRCDDTELDARVDAEVCRRLGVRSILVFPVLKDEHLLGVIEIFSPVPHAFTDREIQTLAALSRSVVGNIDRAAAVHVPPAPEEESASPTASEEQAASESAVPVVSFSPETRDGKNHPRDYWTSILMVMVIGLAVVLGWMVGRVGQQRVERSATVEPIVTKPAANSAAPASAVTQLQTPTSSPTAAVPPANEPRPIGSANVPASKKTATNSTPDGGLVVYEKGRVIFRMTPQTSGQLASNVTTGAPAQGASSQGSGVDQSHPPQISSQLASEYIARRVEPEYPEQARAQHIQGPVVLQVVVGKDGSVEKLETISGDPQLATAAADAVQQWRFKPFLRNGQPEEFQTRITVSFRLP